MNTKQIRLIGGITSLLIVAALACGIGGRTPVQPTPTEDLGVAATVEFMATQIRQEMEAEATAQAEVAATADALAMQLTATEQAMEAEATMQAGLTATAQALEIEGTATAEALAAFATATAEAKLAEIAAYRFFDPFEVNQFNWRERDNEESEFWTGSTRIQNGIYNWNVDTVYDAFVAWADFGEDESIRDFDLAVKARLEEGLSNGHCYGVLFRKSPDGFSAGSYIMSLCENGYFVINYYDGDVGWSPIQDGTTTDVINQFDWNLIEISARGPNFTLFINHQQVATFSDSRLAEGMVSIMIDVYDDSPGRIVFDLFALQPR